MSLGSNLGFLSVVLAFAATAGAGYYGYPWLEEFFRLRVTRYIDWIVTTQEKMFRPVRQKSIVIALLISTLLMTYLGYALSRGNEWITLGFSMFFLWIGWSLPRWFVQIRWHRRIQMFDAQLVDGLNLMSNSLKSGLNIQQVIQVLVQEMPNPISQEFGLVLSQQKIGLTIDEALEKMLERIPSEDLSVAIHSVLILRETGGDLSETFETIANTIRERRKVDGKIKAMTQQGKTQGLLLFMMPFALGLLLYLMSPEFLTPLFSTQTGWMMIVVMLVFQIVGGLWLKKVVTIDV